MLHTDSSPWNDTQTGRHARVAPAKSVSMLAYRSRAVAAPTERDLQNIVRQAQQRNRTERVTGLLIYDQGCFFQWLEGPPAGIARVWDSITQDKRHRDIEILREQSMPKRFFADWDMRLAQRARGRIDTTLAVVKAPQELLKQLRIEPSVMGKGAWDQLFADVVIPRLRASHSHRSSHLSRDRQPQWVPAEAHAPKVWHAQRGAAAELAGLVLAVESGAAPIYLNTLVEQGATLEALFSEVFEPTARYLGDLWEDDQCHEIEMTLGLGRLQIEAHRLGATADRQIQVTKPGHAILIAPQPGEPHSLGTVMASELFARDGWDVSCEFPSTDAGLRDIVHERWFDVLDLSLSAAMRRDQQLHAMGVTIHAALAASLNPALVVLVDGRKFFERPQAFLDVNAHAGCVTVVEAVPAAQRLIEALTIAAAQKKAIRHAGPPSGGLQSAESQAASLRLFERRFRSTVF